MIQNESIEIVGLNCDGAYVPSNVPFFAGYRDIDLGRVVAMVGYESFWILPEVMKSGDLEEIEPYPIFEIEYGLAESFLDFDRFERNITTDALALTDEFVGLHRVNFTVIDEYGAEATYKWELLVLVPTWSDPDIELMSDLDEDDFSRTYSCPVE